ncbi:MAG: MjaI family restriction endonuclease [Calditrichaceae bacterium]|nr:MjaI family restriction endonuclease [Calditrichaceae bacterium]
MKDLVIIKTFIGFQFQEAILAKAVNLINTTYKLAVPSEESKGIDGYIGDQAVSIKPETYKLKLSLLENIEAKFIFYKKTKTGITIDIEDLF